MKKVLLSMLAVFGLATSAWADAATGSAENPLSVDDLLEIPAEAVSDVYVKGYIVGCIDGASLETGATFKAPWPSKATTNLLIAGSSAETDLGYMLPVALPTGDIRNALNLVAHPENYGHEVILCGTHTTYFKVSGLKELTSYKWVGDAPVADPSQTPTYETGSATKPLTVAEFLEMGTPALSVADTFVEGYIVGFVPDKSIDEAVFGATGDVVAATNILIAASADVKDIASVIPVALPAGEVRTGLNLKDNPANLGKKVILMGSHETYFGANGLKSVSWYSLDGVAPIPLPTPALWESLSANNTSCDWTFENVEMAEGLTYVWAWKTYNDKGYLNGSSFYQSPKAAKAYAIAPEVIDLTGCTDVAATFDHAAKFQTTLRDLCGFVVREEGATEWTKLEIPVWPEAGSWTFTNCGNIDLKAYEGKKIQVAFLYEGNEQGADTWEIRDFKITGNKENGVHEILLGSEVYVENGNIVAPEGTKVFNLNGVQTGTQNLSAGVYVVVVANKAVKVLVK